MFFLSENAVDAALEEFLVALAHKIVEFWVCN